MRKEEHKHAWCSWFQVTLFSGFVSYQMVREAYEGRFTVSFLVLSIYRIELSPLGTLVVMVLMLCFASYLHRSFQFLVLLFLISVFILKVLDNLKLVLELASTVAHRIH